ncbi:GNAT family N-acetyltransferase [Celeribacter sp.]|uniref:GNAT family N-acetyltransferase n=1 Tax=Celeribacter sp. TaxID=1890673 RepID=UPI003A959864
MLNTPEFMREMKRGEEAAVDALLDSAYGNDRARRMVDDLRKSRLIAGEMVLPMQGEVIGYAALTTIETPKGWLALAPVAILPDVQGRGYGRRLVGMITEWARLSQRRLISIGNPAFCESCGFTSLPDEIEGNRGDLRAGGAEIAASGALTLPRPLR